MSSNAVPFLYGMAGIVFARTTHLALSFWSFVLMGFHLGLHLAPGVAFRLLEMLVGKDKALIVSKSMGFT